MNTEHQHRKKEGRPISLNSYETVRLERPQAGENIEIIVKSGVIRIAGNQSNNAKDITLAFACRADAFKFHYPEDLEIAIEAITDTTYIVESIGKKRCDTGDAIMEWIIQLHIMLIMTLVVLHQLLLESLWQLLLIKQRLISRPWAYQF